MVQECGYDMAGALLTQLYGPLQPRRTNLSGLGQLLRFNQSHFFPNTGAWNCNVSCWASAAQGRPCPCTGMFDDAVVYVPKACGVGDIPRPNYPPAVANGSEPGPTAPGKETCRVHVVYPGCGCGPNMGPNYGGITRFAGFNYWAESNNLIILYPGHDVSTENARCIHQKISLTSKVCACCAGQGGTQSYDGLPSWKGLGPCWNSIGDPHASDRQGLQMNVVNRMVDWLAAGPGVGSATK